MGRAAERSHGVCPLHTDSIRVTFEKGQYESEHGAWRLYAVSLKRAWMPNFINSVSTASSTSTPIKQTLAFPIDSNSIRYSHFTMAITTDVPNTPAVEPQAEPQAQANFYVPETPAAPGSHIVKMPSGFIAVRILQIIFATIVLALSAYLISRTFNTTYGLSQEGFAMATAIITLIICIYDIVAEKTAQSAYNMWAVLSLDILAVIFWLVSMSVLANLRATFTIPVEVQTSCDEFGCYKKMMKREVVGGYIWLDILAVDSVMSAILMYVDSARLKHESRLTEGYRVLFIISLSMFGAALHRHTTTNGNITSDKMEMGQASAPAQTAAPAPEYPPAPQQTMHTGVSGVSSVSGVSPAQHTQPVYQNGNPAPAYSQVEQQQAYGATPTYEGKA